MAIGATTVGTGGDWPPSFSLGDQQCIGPPELLGRGFQKARHFTASSHQNAGFSILSFHKFSGGGDTPGPSQRVGATPFRTQHPARPFCRARVASASVLGPKPWSPSTFQSWLRPCRWRFLNGTVATAGQVSVQTY